MIWCDISWLELKKVRGHTGCHCRSLAFFSDTKSFRSSKKKADIKFSLTLKYWIIIKEGQGNVAKSKLIPNWFVEIKQKNVVLSNRVIVKR